MLRAIVVLLLLLNLGLWTWQRGGSEAERDPQRLARQLNADSVRLVPPTEAASAVEAKPMCLEAGPFAADELVAAEQALAALPPGSWKRVELPVTPGFVVYIGRFADGSSAQRRVDELRQRGFDAELAQEDLPGLAPGVVLARHAKREEAEAALEAINARARAPKLARVVELGAEPRVLLRLQQTSPELRAQVAGLEPTPALRGGFRGCPAEAQAAR